MVVGQEAAKIGRALPESLRGLAQDNALVGGENADRVNRSRITIAQALLANKMPPFFIQVTTASIE